MSPFRDVTGSTEEESERSSAALPRLLHHRAKSQLAVIDGVVVVEAHFGEFVPQIDEFGALPAEGWASCSLALAASMIASVSAFPLAFDQT